MIAQLSPLIMGLMSQIQAGRNAGVLHHWDCTLRAGETNIPVMFVNAVEVNRDYLENYTDIISVSIKIDEVLRNTIVYPRRDQLRITLSRKPIRSEYTGKGANYDNYVEYTAKLYLTTDDQMTAKSVLTHIDNAADKGATTDIELQIYSPSLDLIRASKYGTNHRNCTGADALVTALSNFIALPGDDNGVKGIDLYPDVMKTLRDQIIIPHDTPVYRVPHVINLDSGGIYTTGFNHYIQKGMWYIYPPWDISRYLKHSGYTLTILNVPPSALPGIEKSYCINGREVILIATGDTKQIDHVERDQVNMGTGVRFTDPSVQLNNGYVNEGGKITSAAKGSLNEVTVIPRRDGISMMSGKSRTSRYAIEYSELAKRKGSTISLFWENSNPDVMIPGMGIKYIFMDKGRPIIRHGTLTGAVSRSIISNKTSLDPVYAYTSYLRLFIANDEVVI